MEQGSAAMGRLPAPERRFPAMIAAGAGYQVAISTVVDSMGSGEHCRRTT